MIDEDPAEPLAEGVPALEEACGWALFRSRRGRLCATTSGWPALAALAAAAIAAALAAALIAAAALLLDEPVNAPGCKFCRVAG